MSRAVRWIAVGLTLGLGGAELQAASFDCGRAHFADEKAICASRALNDQDVRVALLYDINRRTLAMGGRGALQDGQRAWLAERRRCGANRACLTRLYDQRVRQLEASMERIYRNAPF